MIARLASVVTFAGTTFAAAGTVAAQSECGGSAADRAATIGYLLQVESDSTHGPVSEVKYGDFTNHGPGLLIAIADSTMTMADSVSQVAAARPVAQYALGHMMQPAQCRVIIVGWRRQMTTNSHFTKHVPFRVADLLSAE